MAVLFFAPLGNSSVPVSPHLFPLSLPPFAGTCREGSWEHDKLHEWFGPSTFGMASSQVAQMYRDKARHHEKAKREADAARKAEMGLL